MLSVSLQWVLYVLVCIAEMERVLEQIDFSIHQKTDTAFESCAGFFCILNAPYYIISHLFRYLTKDSAVDCSAGSDSVSGFGSDSDCGSSAADFGIGSAVGSDSDSAGSCSVPDSDFDVTSMHSFSPHKRLPACRSLCGTANDIPS